MRSRCSSWWTHSPHPDSQIARDSTRKAPACIHHFLMCPYGRGHWKPERLQGATGRGAPALDAQLQAEAFVCASSRSIETKPAEPTLLITLRCVCVYVCVCVCAYPPAERVPIIKRTPAFKGRGLQQQVTTILMSGLSALCSGTPPCNRTIISSLGPPFSHNKS